MAALSGPDASHEHRAGLPVCLAVVWVAATAVGMAGAPAALGVTLGALTLAAAIGMWWCRRPCAAHLWCLLSAFLLAVAWSGLMVRYVPADHISRCLRDHGVPVHLTGVVVDAPTLRGSQGVFSGFSRHATSTGFVLDLQTVEVGGQLSAASGRLQVRVGEVVSTLADGAVVQAEGWLWPLRPAQNPGEFDYSRWLGCRGIDGQLLIERAENLTVLAARPPSPLHRAHDRLITLAAESLHAGLSGEPDPANVFLDAVLLGVRGRQTSELYQPFQRTGLIHLLSISGAHLAILLGLVWGFARLTGSHPFASAIVVLLTLAVYLLVVPPDVPIIRSGIMAGAFCLACASGRRVGSMQALAAATILVLVLWPAELASPGFQLSFGIVAGFLLFVTPVHRWLLRESDLLEGLPSSRPAIVQWAGGWLAVNIVAFLIAVPIVAYHFRLVSLGSVPVAILGAPLVTAVLAIGYLKIALGLLLPSAGLLLAGPLHAAARALVWCVDTAANLPGVAIQLVGPPSLAWTVAGLALAVALFCGLFRQRWPALLAVTTLWVGWAFAGDLEAWLMPRLAAPSVTLNMLSVGDGACYVLRLRDPHRGQGVFLFDVGSQDRPDVGGRVAAPALRALGVRHLQAVFISHADLDHFCGLPDLLDAIPVQRVIVPPQFLDASHDARSPAALAVEAVRQHGIALETATSGWREQWGAGDLQTLWPEDSPQKLSSNDTSLVLAVRVGGRRLLLWGDVQQVGMKQLLAVESDLRAEVCDLPHHGSFVPASSAWLGAVVPRVVLQSCGPDRLLSDPWLDVLTQVGADRLSSARCGMVQARLTANGLSLQTFQETPPPAER